MARELKSSDCMAHVMAIGALVTKWTYGVVLPTLIDHNI